MRPYKAWTGHLIDLDKVVAIKMDDPVFGGYPTSNYLDATSEFGISVFFPESGYKPLRLEVRYEAGPPPWSGEGGPMWFQEAKTPPTQWAPGGYLYDKLKCFLDDRFADLRKAWTDEAKP